METARFTIEPVRSEKDLQSLRNLFAAYTEWLSLDLTFQDYASELATLPAKYSPPDGELLLAKDPSGQPLGCVALRSLPQQQQQQDSKCCEMKRLYTLPSSRGLGLGRTLVCEALDIARERGYESCMLDTLPHMHAALQLYESVGFERCEAYYDTPLAGTVFLKCNLLTMQSLHSLQRERMPREIGDAKSA